MMANWTYARRRPQDTGWTPEELFLFHLVRQAIRIGHPGGPDAWGAGETPDWPRLLERAIDGGTASLAYACLRDTDGTPAPWLSRLRDLYLLTGAENARHLAYARRLFSACAEAGVEVMALRGMAFMESLYQDVALRPVSDIDILVRSAARPRLESVLESLGCWRVEGHPHQWTNESVLFDVHVDLAGADRIAARRRAVAIDMEAVWDASAPATVAGVEVRTLSWTDALLTCCLHALKHSCDRVLWFADLAMLIASRKDVPWKGVVARAHRFHLTKPAGYALSYARNTIGAAVPQDVLDALRPTRTGWLERRCMGRVLRGEPAGRFGEVFTLFMMERARDRLAFILETCFPKAEVIVQSYGAAADRLPARSRRLRHVVDMAFDVLRYGVLSSKTTDRSVTG